MEHRREERDNVENLSLRKAEEINQRNIEERKSDDVSGGPFTQRKCTVFSIDQIINS